MKHKLVGLLGKAQNGKTTVAQHLVETRDAYVVNFARLIKQDLALRFGLTQGQLHGKLKEVFIKTGPLKGWTPRAMMQQYGDWLKEFDRGIFTNDGKAQIEEVWSRNPDRLIVIEDLRFPTMVEKQIILGNEHIKTLPGEDELTRSLGGIIIQVVRLGYKSKTDQSGITDHDSERLQDEIKPDYRLEAPDGNIEFLLRAVDDIIDGIIDSTRITN